MGWLASKEKGEGWVGFNKPPFPLQPASPMFFHLKVEGQVGVRGTSVGSSLPVEGLIRRKEEASSYCRTLTA